MGDWYIPPGCAYMLSSNNSVSWNCVVLCKCRARYYIVRFIVFRGSTAVYFWRMYRDSDISASPHTQEYIWWQKSTCPAGHFWAMSSCWEDSSYVSGHSCRCACCFVWCLQTAIQTKKPDKFCLQIFAICYLDNCFIHIGVYFRLLTRRQAHLP